MAGAFQSRVGAIYSNAQSLCEGVGSLGEAHCMAGAFRSGSASTYNNARTLCEGVSEAQGLCLEGAFRSGVVNIRENNARTLYQ